MDKVSESQASTTRRTLSRSFGLLAAAVLLACCVGLASPGKATADRGVVLRGAERSCRIRDYQCSFSISSYELRCNGDSALLTVRLTHDDGSPVVGYALSLGISQGTVTAPSRRTQVRVVGTGSYLVDTDSHGVVRALLTPTPGQFGEFEYRISGSFYLVSCPFSADRTYVVDGNIVRSGGRPRSVAGLQVALYSIGYKASVSTPVHTQRTDRGGSFSWSGMTAVWPEDTT